MATFTKDEILAYIPCTPWNPTLIALYPGTSATGPQIKSYVEGLCGDCKPLAWLMAQSLALAQEFVGVCSVDPDTQDDQGRMSLHYAAMAALPDVITYLRGQGATNTIQDDQNRTPIDVANEYGDDAVIAAMTA